MALTGEQVERLTDVLSTAFDPFTLDRMVTTRVDRRGLQQYTSSLIPLPAQAFELVKHAEAEDFTLRLIDAARELRPRNAQLLALADELELTAHRKLERIVRAKHEFQDLFLFRSRITEIEFQVGRLELDIVNEGGRSGKLTGTAFLVGPDVVLTNYHVIEPLIHQTGGWTGDAKNALVRFDYKRIGRDEVNEGVTYGLADQWLIDSSPYGTGEATAEELDHALIRLDRPAGEEAVGGWPAAVSPPRRNWMMLERSGHPFCPDTEMIIVQHPKGGPLAIAVDTESIIQLNASKTRVRHRTNTEEGSSGSPCFNMALQLVALHHAGDPQYGPAKFNSGVPIDTIVALLEKRGIQLAG